MMARCHVIATADTIAVQELAGNVTSLAAGVTVPNADAMDGFIHAGVSDFVALSHMDLTELGREIEAELVEAPKQPEDALMRGDLAMAAAANAGRSHSAPLRTSPDGSMPAPLLQPSASAANRGR